MRRPQVGNLLVPLNNTSRVVLHNNIEIAIQAATDPLHPCNLATGLAGQVTVLLDKIDPDQAQANEAEGWFLGAAHDGDHMIEVEFGLADRGEMRRLKGSEVRIGDRIVNLHSRANSGRPDVTGRMKPSPSAAPRREVTDVTTRTLASSRQQQARPLTDHDRRRQAA
jgi:hypothetical protein